MPSFDPDSCFQQSESALPRPRKIAALELAKLLGFPDSSGDCTPTSQHGASHWTGDRVGLGVRGHRGAGNIKSIQSVNNKG